MWHAHETFSPTYSFDHCGLLRLRTIFNLDVLFGTASFNGLEIADTSVPLFFV
jgi:hypothetical protein